jgi:hypothetical protein
LVTRNPYGNLTGQKPHKWGFATDGQLYFTDILSSRTQYPRYHVYSNSVSYDYPNDVPAELNSRFTNILRTRYFQYLNAHKRLPKWVIN